MTSPREFGRIGDEIVEEVTLRSPAGASASVLTWGATLRDLVVPVDGAEMRRVVLGWETIDGIRADAGYLGVIAGRVANRIGGGGFHLAGKRHDLAVNEGASTTLHGGPKGFSRRNWSILEARDDAVVLGLVSQDGDQGFPGRVEARCRYAFVEDATLAVELEATCDAPTPINLTNHAYFTLDQGGDCRRHLLRIAAEHYTPADDALIPLGGIVPVAETKFDFREPRPIGGDYDVNFALAGRPGETIVAAQVTAPDGRLMLEVVTDQPGIQLYTATFLEGGEPAVGHLRIGPHAGFCLETQGFPDAPNRRQFPSVTVRPGETYRNHTLFRFRAP